MSGSQTSWVRFFGVVLAVTCFCGLMLSHLPAWIGVWLASAVIGILAAFSADSARGRKFSRSGDASNGSTQDPSEQWSAADWKSWANEQADVLQAESEAIADRERRLTEKLMRYHELLEFPDPETSSHREDDSAVLSERDRQVQQILEVEAAKVYEKVRTSAYSVDGRIDINLLRADTLDLIERVAGIYQPDSRQPLLETSFNDLARAFSRICLHSLALLEQMPVDVRNYTLNELLTYFQRATRAYGAYQMVSPWMKRLGRTAYAGRLAAGANPVTLGAWWLASEVAQRGTRHVVSNVIDRQAIAVLHDLVSVVGTEVANIYGPGYRHRDPAWVYGSELTELLSRFPESRESLRLALKELTALPLKCEYDRIYLYRCLATSKPSGFLLSDSAALTRDQRDTIAVNLERFVDDVLHGIDDDALKKWATEAESRLDLRLKLGHRLASDSQSTTELISDSVKSIWGFSVSILHASPDSTLHQIESRQLLKMLSLEVRQQLLTELKTNQQPEFRVPDLDPSSKLLAVYLEELFQCAVASHQVDAHHFGLLIETAMHFRMSESDALQLITSACRKHLFSLNASQDACKSLTDDHAIAATFAAGRHEKLLDAFTSIDVPQNDAPQMDAPPMDAPPMDAPPMGAETRESQRSAEGDAALLVFEDVNSHQRRLALMTEPFVDHGPWDSVRQWRVEPVEGYVYDDCRITRIAADQSSTADSTDPPSAWADVTTLVLSGSILNRKFEKRFASLIQPTDETTGQTSH